MCILIQHHICQASSRLKKSNIFDFRWPKGSDLQSLETIWLFEKVIYKLELWLPNYTWRLEEQTYNTRKIIFYSVKAKGILDVCIYTQLFFLYSERLWHARSQQIYKNNLLVFACNSKATEGMHRHYYITLRWFCKLKNQISDFQSFHVNKAF